MNTKSTTADTAIGEQEIIRTYLDRLRLDLVVAARITKVHREWSRALMPDQFASFVRALMPDRSRARIAPVFMSRQTSAGASGRAIFPVL